MAVKAKSRSPRGENAPILATVPAPVTPIDRIVIDIRKFIAGAIFFNTKAAEKIGMSLTDMQMIHILQLYGPATPGRLGVWSGLSSGGVTGALGRAEVAGMYEEVERETRRLLATLPSGDLEAVIRFFETLRSAGTDGNT